jgi:hypothetical protein
MTRYKLISECDGTTVKHRVYNVTNGKEQTEYLDRAGVTLRMQVGINEFDFKEHQKDGLTKIVTEFKFNNKNKTNGEKRK